MKIILGFGGSSSDYLSLDFAIQLFHGKSVLFVGAVISELQRSQAFDACEGNCMKSSKSVQEKKLRSGRQKFYQVLASSSAAFGAQYAIHKENGCSVPEVIRETHYADLLIVSAITFHAYWTKGKMTTAFSKTLKTAMCPLLVLPEKPQRIGQVIMTYDGSPSAMFTIKHFLYLLPALDAELPVTVLTNYASDGLSGQEEKLFLEYLKLYFQNIALQRMGNNEYKTMHCAVDIPAQTLWLMTTSSEQKRPYISKLFTEQQECMPLRFYANKC